MEIKVPQLPESVSDATLVAWHFKKGDKVERDENLADLETDKVVLEVPAPAAGVLKEIKVEDGATVEAGDVIAVLDEDADEGHADEEDDESGDDAGDGDDDAKESAVDEDAGENGDKERDKGGDKGRKKDSDGNGKKDDQKDGDKDADAEDEPGDADDARAAKQKGSGAAVKTSPAVRRLLEEHDLDATMVTGSGKDGRITKADVMAFLKSDESGEVAPGESEPVAPDEAPAPAERNDRRVPMTRLRARIAERLVEAQQTAAMLTTFNEVDLTEVIEMRSRYRETFEKRHGVRLGFMSFFAKAATEALKRFPVVNASVEGTEIVYHDYYDIGIAVSTERGLMVPVIRDVDRMSFGDFEKVLGELAQKAQDGSIDMDDLTGGTFTITNGGIFGSMMSTPILNQPQSAILGMHAIQKRPMVIDDEIVVRPMMYVALTYDHRIVDGKDSVQFLVALKELLEDPSRLLLQI